ncbi:MAG: 1-acyl-sn-glycerol-3-phosphate acyltransferase [Candidatus Amoebophilus sp.]
MYRKLRYDPILANPTDWPIVKMYQDKDTFVQSVSDKAVADILTLQQNTLALRKDLAKSLAQDQARLQRMQWKVDAKDDASFWAQKIDALNQEQVPLPELLKDITLHYAKEIVGGFNLWHYRLAQATASYTLNRLLNPVNPRRLRTLPQIRARLQEQIPILGAINELRQLARLGTVVMVPTHCSHFDSVLIGWVIETLGLPPFTYGAGLNLFNRQFFAYFMNRLGTYKVDRRKKDVAYLTTLKAYSSLSLHLGCHSLFYPGGTRSRTGALENSLKLGLLGTTIEAQQINYQVHGAAATKIFIVPVVFNYHFVLEAPFLIREYLAEQGNYVYTPKKDWLNNSYKLLKLIKAFATESSSIVVSIGQPMDVLGNKVDTAGHSYNLQGERIDLYQHFKEKVEVKHETEQENKERTKALGQHIIESYRINNCVLTSCLLAFTAFELMRTKHATIALKDFLNLPSNALTISYTDLEKAFAQVREAVLTLGKQSRIRVSEKLQQGTIENMIVDGFSNLGLYHHQLPLIRDKNGNITTRDICSLLYYHNKLTGYELEKYI